MDVDQDFAAIVSEAGVAVNETLSYWRISSENPSLTLEQLRANLKVDCCLTTIWHELQRQHKTFKKTLSASEQHRTDVKAHRQRWKRMQRRLKMALWRNLWVKL
jgi:hypothetical protein